MWTIQKPLVGALHSFDTCRAGVTIPDLSQRLQNARQAIGEAETAFDDAAINGTAHLIEPATHVGTVTRNEMELLYNRHMARAKSRGRPIYDELMLAAENEMCPFCGHRGVSTLDHTLPKAHHPALAVTPLNLVPCCKDCNHGKGIFAPDTAEQQWLNAYYDNVAGDRWLYAVVVEGSPPAARFYVEVPNAWDDVTGARVQNHFARLGLAKLYASQAGRQLQNARQALGEIFEAAGPEAVREDLMRRFRSHRTIAENSWEGALYEASAGSDWYCEGGFRA
jgi:hypothetical protein